MRIDAKFEKVSFERFKKDYVDTFFPDYLKASDCEIGMINREIQECYDSIRLPRRSTRGSAGYDFFSPYSLRIEHGDNVKIPTGIKCSIPDGWVLQIYPRSSYGFKYGVELSNTIGIIDSDYYDNENNEGHIFCKFTNKDSTVRKDLKINDGDAFCQGIFVQYGTTVDDDADGKRIGGIGSTSK